ncbi:thiamine pyrophosphate-binding protein [Pseudochelatococcus sp. B33]
MWGSDLIAKAIVDLGFSFAAINPGASFRGLHDSLVNDSDQAIPFVVCLHEEHAIALAHGWSKVTGKPSLAIVHSNVGLMHATMAIYNAWVDRAPVVVLNASGPLDADHRRPWIEWIHTSQDHGALVRNFTKWDDAPASAPASVDALAEAVMLSSVAPTGPTFVCLDVGVQEALLPSPSYKVPALKAGNTVIPAPEAVQRVVTRLAECRRIAMLVGRTAVDTEAWRARIRLAETLNAAVITDIKTSAGFPLSHPNHVGAPGFSLDQEQVATLNKADAIIALDWIDLDNTLRRLDSRPFVAAASLDPLAARGWVKTTFRPPAVDELFLVTTDALVGALLDALPRNGADMALELWWKAAGPVQAPAHAEAASLSDPAYANIASGIAAIREEMPVSITRYPLGWPPALTSFEEPLDYVGRDGGEGLASGPGIAVGVAYALKESGRLTVAVLGDGDFLMGNTSLWTAAAENLPLLIVVAANGVYGNDVVHQERIAKDRGRPIERKWVGQRIDHPRIGIAELAAALGLRYTRCVSGQEIERAMLEGARYARKGRPALIEVSMTAA